LPIPTAKEINVHDSLDERSACEHFLGKSLADAELLFRDNSIYYQEDLMWMGPIAFQYYGEAAIRYIQGEHAELDADIINCFAGLLEFRLECLPNSLSPIATRLNETCHYILEHWKKFDISPAIYGDLKSRYVLLRTKFTNPK
jgi:hypothetical protein